MEAEQAIEAAEAEAAVIADREALLAPFEGGGEMIDIVEQGRVTYSEPPHRFEAGTPPILEAIALGVDMFDCILPSAFAQQGVAFTSVGKMQLRRSVYKFSEEKLKDLMKVK